MSQERFAVLMSEFTAAVGIDWKGRESHNRARFRFGEVEVEFRYSAARHALFLRAPLWKVDPNKDYAMCLSLLNINGASRYMSALGADGQLCLRGRLLVDQMRGQDLEVEAKAFVAEVAHLQRIFGNNKIAEFLAGDDEAGNAADQPPNQGATTFISP
ncbi:MAG: type III secretion system chaperone [Betaproteobacteria bacterium]|nr:type III secretion system chaperone [Betaproteobacteria bacterium]